MFKDWPTMATELTGTFGRCAPAPDVMKGFSALAQAALKAMRWIPRPRN